MLRGVVLLLQHQGWGLSSSCASVLVFSWPWSGERLMGIGFVLQEGAEGPRPALQHAEESPGPDQGVGRKGPSLWGACPSDSPQSCLPWGGLYRALPLGTAGVTQVWGESRTPGYWGRQGLCVHCSNCPPLLPRPTPVRGPSWSR